MDCDEANMDNIREINTFSPVVRYVNCMLLDMAAKDRFPQTLTISGVLPKLSTKAGQWLTAEDLNAVDLPHAINRLKVMCQLDPIQYKEPITGQFLLRIAKRDFVVYVCFNDRSSPPSCQITIEPDDSPEPERKDAQ